MKIAGQPVPKYISLYIERRNHYCQEHMTSKKPPRCEECKEISLDKKQHLHPFDFIIDTIRPNTHPLKNMMRLAAWLEFQMYIGKISCYEARKALCEAYPDSNCMKRGGRYDISAIARIIPYHDSRRTV